MPVSKFTLPDPSSIYFIQEYHYGGYVVWLLSPDWESTNVLKQYEDFQEVEKALDPLSKWGGADKRSKNLFPEFEVERPNLEWLAWEFGTEKLKEVKEALSRLGKKPHAWKNIASV